MLVGTAHTLGHAGRRCIAYRPRELFLATSCRITARPTPEVQRMPSVPRHLSAITAMCNEFADSTAAQLSSAGMQDAAPLSARHATHRIRQSCLISRGPLVATSPDPALPCCMPLTGKDAGSIHPHPETGCGGACRASAGQLPTRSGCMQHAIEPREIYACSIIHHPWSYLSVRTDDRKMFHGCIPP
jgi:hypothetical protein